MLSRGSSSGNQKLIRGQASLESQLANQEKMLAKMEAMMREMQKRLHTLENESDHLHDSLSRTDEKMEWLDSKMHDLLAASSNPPQRSDDKEDFYDGWGDEEFRQYDLDGNEIRS
jgi:chromosome segregation ATPase